MFARFHVQVRYCVTYIISSTIRVTRDKISSTTNLLSLYYKISYYTGMGILQGAGTFDYTEAACDTQICVRHYDYY